MILSKKDNEIKWYWSDGKMHTLSVGTEDTDISLKDLYDKCHKIVEEKNDLCKKIFYLGFSLTGNESGAWGFLMGWLTRSIKGDTQWNINHLEEEVSEDEARDHLATIMEEGAKLIREGKKGDKPKALSPLLGGGDGTEMFS